MDRKALNSSPIDPYQSRRICSLKFLPPQGLCCHGQDNNVASYFIGYPNQYEVTKG
ncbi:hypothetical protein RchiOBHm_Chr6g0297341 [Rosa chinensis]|uniref:Uncharacterized protein n=1 Tax=Rosa chinensis TaxID=74649 RepID=A0A2P6PXR6_ROSCH|nr:hypothetical protein RchiOBHm_Chr6g0297341 [Rosa chinensis]